MATKFVSERNIKFLLYEVFDVESLTKYKYYSEHNRKLFDLVLKAAVKLGYRGCPIVQLSLGDKNDCRIHPIHEGTTGIQAMDLLGRKVAIKNGEAFLLHINELQDTIAAAKEYQALEK